MYTGQIAVISNKATWLSDVMEIVDEADGTVTDLTTVDPLDIRVSIMDHYSSLVTATIDNGKVTLPGPGFQWRFEATDLRNLCAGTHRLGIKVTIDGVVLDLMDGTIVVLEGV